MGPCLICGWLTCRCVRPATYTYTSGEGTGPHIPQVEVAPFIVASEGSEERARLAEMVTRELRRGRSPIIRQGPGERLTIIPRRPSIDTYKAAVRRKHEQLQAARARIAELERRIETRGGDWRRRD